jgi:hypothetical protein
VTDVARIDLEWDGKRLYAQAVMLPGWRALAGSSAEHSRVFSQFCTGVDDLTSFEVGLLMHQCVQHLTDSWDFERLLTRSEGGTQVMFGPLLKAQVDRQQDLNDDQDQDHGVH